MRKTLSISIAMLAVLLLALSGASALDVAGYAVKSADASRQILKLGSGKNAKEMLFVIDQNGEVIVADTDLDGSLADEKPIERAKVLTSSIVTSSRFTMSVTAPFGKVDPKAKYGLSIYVYHKMKNKSGQTPYVRVIGNVALKSDGQDWRYMFLGAGGKADKKDPGLTRQSLGTRVTLEVTAKKNADKIDIEAAIRDRDGQILRTASNGANELAPHLKVIRPDGKIVTDKDLSYG